MELTVYVKVECACGQQYELDVDTLPQTMACGVCREGVKLPDFNLLEGRFQHWIDRRRKRKVSRKFAPKGLRRV